MPNPIPQLESVCAKDLLTQPIESLGFTIDAILPHGLFILAGSPKVGKSSAGQGRGHSRRAGYS